MAAGHPPELIPPVKHTSSTANAPGPMRLNTFRTPATLLIFFLAFFAITTLAGCAKSEPQKNRTAHLGGNTLAETIADNRARLLAIQGVLKVEAADCGIDSCIKVTVDHKTAILNAQIPMMLETYQVNVVEATR